jgi:L-amino acid N-acyltransferase
MITFRQAEIEDLEAIREIYNDAILHTAAVYEYEPFTPDYINQWFAEKMKHQFPIIVAIENRELTGFATYGIFRTRAAYYRTMEHSVYIHPNHRRKGIGRALLRQIMGAAESRGIHVLVGGIDAQNEESIQLHLSEGFRIAGTIHEAAWKFDRWLDLVFMEKKLEKS